VLTDFNWFNFIDTQQDANCENSLVMIIVTEWDPMRSAGKHICLEYTEEPKKLWSFNRGYLWTFSKLNRNVLYSVQCDSLSKDDASHMNTRATLPNGRTVKKVAERCVYIFFAALYKFWVYLNPWSKIICVNLITSLHTAAYCIMDESDIRDSHTGLFLPKTWRQETTNIILKWVLKTEYPRMESRLIWLRVW
jgi:hypothetical protein